MGPMVNRFKSFNKNLKTKFKNDRQIMSMQMNEFKHEPNTKTFTNQQKPRKLMIIIK